MGWSGGTYRKGNYGTNGWTGDASLGIGIEAGRHDTQDDDFANGINQCLNKDGSNAATGNLNLGGNKLTNVAVGTVSTDAITLGQLQGPQTVNVTNYFPLTATQFSNDAGASNVNLQKSRGASVGTNTIVQNADILGAINFAGANGTGYTQAGSISGWVDGTPGATNDMPGRLVFSTTADGSGTPTERMRITNSGNVGIGTTAPTSALQVSGPIDNTPDAAGVHAGIISGYACIELCEATGGIIDFTTPGVDVKGRIIYVHSDNAMTFNTNGSEKARITSSGQYLIGKTSAGTSGTGSYFDPSTAGFPALLVNCKTWSGNLLALQNHHNGTYVGGINYSDTATSFPTSSDYRLKENIVDIDDALGRVTQLKPCRFNFIIKPDETIDGFIAHEVQSVVPNAVEGEKDAVNEDGSIKVQSLDNSKLVPLLTAAIQELNAKVESLEARIAALEA